ncbi:unnamed protein product [Durusdinium trenchii]|uniref:A-kinase anchor protein 7-like phosphoesterase domain-containing protein n=1 Tax=Durusdinium trenchii TaxID=1381693 RepID=A0ABP0K078_9DINO
MIVAHRSTKKASPEWSGQPEECEMRNPPQFELPRLNALDCVLFAVFVRDLEFRNAYNAYTVELCFGLACSAVLWRKPSLSLLVFPVIGLLLKEGTMQLTGFQSSQQVDICITNRCLWLYSVYMNKADLPVIGSQNQGEFCSAAGIASLACMLPCGLKSVIARQRVKSFSFLALKEKAARALNFVHPQSGNVWKPRHLFTETPSGNLRELQTSELQREKVLWAEPPWHAGAVLQQGLTSRRRWTWGSRIYQRLLRMPCCVPLHRLWHSARSTASAAKGGARSSPRREKKPQDPKRPSHFISVRMGEDVRKAAVKVQKECLIPSSQLHLTLLTLTLQTEEDIQVAKERLNQVADAEGFSFKLQGLESFGHRVLFARARDDGSQGFASLCSLHTRVLRHDAKRLGLQMRSDGSVALKDLVALSFFRTNGYSEADVEREVRCNAKQRFSLWLDDGVKRIRANQGHKMKEVVDSELLTPILSASELPVCIHGTYMKRWHYKKKCYVDVWPAIKREGLKPMGRNHIHFVPHEVGSRTVISGMRQDCTVAIYLDVPKALDMGIKLFRSANDVVLTRGDEAGHVPTELFTRVVEIKTGRLLWCRSGTMWRLPTPPSRESMGGKGWSKRQRRLPFLCALAFLARSCDFLSEDEAADAAFMRKHGRQGLVKASERNRLAHALTGNTSGSEDFPSYVRSPSFLTRDFLSEDEEEDSAWAKLEHCKLGCFQPHVTIAKTSRARQHASGARIPESCWQALRKVELGTVMVDSLELCRMKGDEQTGGAPWAESPGVDPNAPSIKLNAWGGNDEILVWHW